jgi:hypothetical protein
LWKEANHCLNAIIDLSKDYISSESDDKEVKTVDDEKKKTEKEGDEEFEVKWPPQGNKWRVTLDRLKNKNKVFMRFVKKTDRKVKGAESRSKFYVKYGNPNYGNLKGLISNSKRQKMKAKQLSEATSDLTFDNEQEEFDKCDDLTGRKLIAYNLG